MWTERSRHGGGDGGWDSVQVVRAHGWMAGHRQNVRCVIAFADGRFASGSEDHTLKVWRENGARTAWELDATLGTTNSSDHCAVARNAPFGTHTEDVACAAVLPNGRFVSGSWDNTLKIWAPPRADATGDAMGDAQRFWRVEATLAGHTGAVTCVVALANGLLVSGSDDRTLRVWEPCDDGAAPVAWECRQCVFSRCDCIALLRDERLVVGSEDKTLTVWGAPPGIDRLLSSATFPYDL
mgnify:FL=1